MKGIGYLTGKYWRKHKKDAFAMMFAGMILTAVVTVVFLMFRMDRNRFRHQYFSARPDFAVYLCDDSDYASDYEQLLAKAREGMTDLDEATLDVYGKIGNGDVAYTYGYLSDPAGIYQLPIESGVMPSNADEVAVDRGVLDRLHWAGKVGDTLTLEDKTYTVTGILDMSSEYYGFEGLYELWEHYKEDETSNCAFPAIYLGAPLADSARYRYVMLDGVIRNVKNLDEAKAKVDSVVNLWAELLDKHIAELGGAEPPVTFHDVLTNDKSGYNLPRVKNYGKDTYWTFVLSAIAMVIAMLSVFSVQRSITLSRRQNISILRRMGVSKGKIYGMYALEGFGFFLQQSILGILAGCGIYELIYLYQVKFLNMGAYSGFTMSPYITYDTVNPFAVALLVSALVLFFAYLLSALFPPREKTHFGKRAKVRGFGGMFRAAFAQPSVTIVQCAALTLICFGSILGYAYFTDAGKTGDYIGPAARPIPSYEIGSADVGFDLEKDGIAEYYSASQPNGTGIGNENATVSLPFADARVSNGFMDDTAQKLGDAACVGYLSQTLLVLDEPDSSLGTPAQIDAPLTIDFLQQLSDPEYQNFFDTGQLGTKALYPIGTCLASEKTLDRVASYVKAGEIHIDKLMSGEEILVVENKAENSPFAVGDELNLASMLDNGNTAIGDIQTPKVRVGAILEAPKRKRGAEVTDPDPDRLTRYIMKNENQATRYFLTTATGAQAMGLHNAAYREVFAEDPIDGGQIPAEAEMTLTSYEGVKRDMLRDKLFSYGGIVLMTVVMALLGFAAYFSGIGMKVRAKSYELSLLRAVGMPHKTLLRKLLLQSVTLPAIAVILSGGAMTLVQKSEWKAYQAYETLYYSRDGIMDSDPKWMEIQQQMDAVEAGHFLNQQLWSVDILVPLLCIFAALVLITAVLLCVAVSKYKRNIASDLNQGRKRQ